jgi:hypothetical protein
VRTLVTPGGRLDPNDRELMALFLHLTRQRSPLARAWLRHDDELMANLMLELDGNENLAAQSTPSREIGMMFVGAEVVSKHIATAMTWTLLRAPADRTSVIGDTPVAIVDPGLPKDAGLGYASSPGTETTLAARSEPLPAHPAPATMRGTIARRRPPRSTT